MKWLGHYPLAVGAADRDRRAASSIFFIFEIWFLVPLPKGPLEDCSASRSRSRSRA